MAKASHVAIAFVILNSVWCKATTSSPACLASEECGISSQASMLLQVARNRESKPVSMEELLQHTEPLQSKLDDLNLKVTKLETVFGRNRGEDSKEEEEREGANSDEEQKEETKGGKNIGRRRRKKGGEYKDVEKKVAKDAKTMPTMGPRNDGENSEEDVNNEEEPTMKPDEKPNKKEEEEPDNKEKSELQKKVGENARRRKQAKKHSENTKHEGGTILNKEEDWAWMDHKNAGEDVKRLKKGQECCDYPGQRRPNKQCKTTCGHGLMCIFVGEEVGPPTCVEEEFDKRSLANVPSWDGVAPRAWNGLETVNAGDQGKKASWKGKGRGVASGRAYSGEYPYDTLMDVDFVIDSNPPWPSRRRKQARRQPKVGAKTSPRNGAKSSPRNGGKSSPRDGAKSSPRDGAKSGALEGKSSARSGAKTSPTDKKPRKAPKSSARNSPEP